MKNSAKKKEVFISKLSTAIDGQLDKQQCPTTFSAPTEGLRVGRHAEKKEINFEEMEKTLTRTGVIHPYLRNRATDFVLNGLDELFPSYSVVFHTEDYVKLIQQCFPQPTNYNKIVIFMRWIRVLVLMNQENREEVAEKTFQTTDGDFFLAFQLLKNLEDPDKKAFYFKTFVWNHIKKKYGENPFNSLQISQDLKRSRYEMDKIISFLFMEGFIEKIEVENSSLPHYKQFKYKRLVGIRRTKIKQF
jgi:hypothetical protein